MELAIHVVAASQCLMRWVPAVWARRELNAMGLANGSKLDGRGRQFQLDKVSLYKDDTRRGKKN